MCVFNYPGGYLIALGVFGFRVFIYLAGRLFNYLGGIWAPGYLIISGVFNYLGGIWLQGI